MIVMLDNFDPKVFFMVFFGTIGFFALCLFGLAGMALWEIPAGHALITSCVLQLAFLTAAVAGIVVVSRKWRAIAKFIADSARAVKARWTAFARRAERAKDSVGGRYRLAGDEIRSARTTVYLRVPK
jgi:hypothetical protein